jgi:hypothetical protein
MGRRRYTDQTGHTLASATWRAGGQMLCLATLCLVLPAAVGFAWAPAALVGMATAGNLCLLTSATLRNIVRWRGQAEGGQEPQSIGIIPLAIAMGAGVEKDAVEVAEWQADHVARIVPERDRPGHYVERVNQRQAQTHQQGNVPGTRLEALGSGNRC